MELKPLNKQSTNPEEIMKNNTVTVLKRHIPSWTAYCDNNNLKYKFVSKDEKEVSYLFESKEEAEKAYNWSQQLHRFDKLEGNVPR